MKRLLGLLSALLLLGLTACGNLDSATGGGGKPPIPGTSKYADNRYLQFMYDPAQGASINNTALNLAVHTQYKAEIQKALDILLKFPLQVGGVTKSTEADVAWYNSLPGNFDLTAANGDLTQALENYLMTAEGQQYLQTYVADLNSTANNIIAYADGVNYNDDNTAKLLETGVFVAQSVAMLFSGAGAAAIVMNSLPMISSFFGGSEMDAVKAQLAQIQQKLVQIEQKIDQIDEKLNQISGQINILVKKPLTDAQDLIKTIYQQINSGLNNDEIKTYLYNTLITGGALSSYTQAYNSAFTAAQQIQNHLTFYNLAGEKEIPGVLVQEYKSQDGVSTILKTTSFSEKLPIHFMQGYLPAQKDTTNGTEGFAVQDIYLMKRLSLARLSLLSKIYEGDELLSRRAAIANQDLISKLNVLKTAMNKAFATLKESVRSKTYNFQLKAGPISCPDGVWGYKFVDNNQNIDLLFPVHYMSIETILGEPLCQSSLIMTTMFNSKRDLFNQNIGDSLEYAVTNVMNEYKDYFIAAAALLADWEIQLRAHIKAAQGL